MSNFIRDKWLGYPMFILMAVALLLSGVVIFYNWVLGIGAIVLTAFLIYLTFQAEFAFQKDMDKYISTISHRVKKVGEEALMELPYGIVLYNETNQVEWTNPYMASLFEKDTVIGYSIEDLSDLLPPLLDGSKESVVIPLVNRQFRVYIKPEERLLYFFDVTEQVKMEQLYEKDQSVLAIIFLDNYDEVTQGLGDQAKSNINSQITSILNQWSMEKGIFLKRTSSDRFFAVMNKEILQELEKTKFDILDEVREMTSKQNLPLTLSIGIGTDSPSLPELGVLAQSSLDLALGRGGDQVAIKQGNGKVKFYGGKTNPVEKRTRVRARVISHALRELILASDKVYVMGHKYPDMDAIGAAIGVLKIAEANHKPGHIIIDEDELDTGVSRMMEEIRGQEDLWDRFISREHALEEQTDNTLLVVVDTHRPSLVIEEKLLNKIEHVIVIDHHRRGEEFINNPVLVYMEPYASSTAELVTELLEYQPKNLKLNMLESTALLSGIIVDTKSFTLRTGSRTFDAASYLRAHGADTVLVQKFLKEDLNQYVRRSKLIERSHLYKDGIAISKGPEEDKFGQVLIAQTADTLLTMNGVQASFVISRRDDKVIGISARSLGDVNVQVIMEKLNGGGHLTNAATQLEDINIDEAEAMLKNAIDDYLEGGEEE